MTSSGRIGRYEIIEEIAAGGQATVYRARDTQLGRVVALKVMHPHLAGNAQYVERFLREARMAASLSHPNVAAIYDVGEDERRHYIAMEFLPRPLDAVLHERGPLPWAEALRIVRQVADALRAANQQGIAHRDLKPRNILLAEDGRPKVADFGIARAADNATMTAAGSIMGTPNYMSPEQAQGERADIRSDLYSLGVVLFELLTGKTPLEGKTLQDVLRHHISASALPMEALDAVDAPAACKGLVGQMLARSLDQRLTRPEALMNAINSLLAAPAMSQPPVARPAQAVASAPRPVSPPVAPRVQQPALIAYTEQAPESDRRPRAGLRRVGSTILTAYAFLSVFVGLGGYLDGAGGAGVAFFAAAALAQWAAVLLVRGRGGRGRAVSLRFALSFAIFIGAVAALPA